MSSETTTSTPAVTFRAKISPLNLAVALSPLFATAVQFSPDGLYITDNPIIIRELKTTFAHLCKEFTPPPPLPPIETVAPVRPSVSRGK